MAKTTRKKSKNKSDNKELDKKTRLLLATLEFVPAYGMSEEALAEGARTARITPAEASRLFPDLPEDLIGALANWADRAMLAAYAKKSKSVRRVRDKVALGVRLRLEALAPYRDAVRIETCELARPWRLSLAARLLFATCDAIWTAAGDQSQDYNYYTKRGLLAGVYAATTLFWLTDDSKGHEATWEFLDHRIENVLKLGQLTGKFKQGPKDMAAAVRQTMRKARDGMGSRRRAA